jgi:hypothetical protein
MAPRNAENKQTMIYRIVLFHDEPAEDFKLAAVWIDQDRVIMT